VLLEDMDRLVQAARRADFSRSWWTWIDRKSTSEVHLHPCRDSKGVQALVLLLNALRIWPGSVCLSGRAVS
jgi:hypothetical protein